MQSWHQLFYAKSMTKFSFSHRTVSLHFYFPCLNKMRPVTFIRRSEVENSLGCTGGEFHSLKKSRGLCLAPAEKYVGLTTAMWRPIAMKTFIRFFFIHFILINLHFQKLIFVPFPYLFDFFLILFWYTGTLLALPENESSLHSLNIYNTHYIFLPRR